MKIIYFEANFGCLAPRKFPVAIFSSNFEERLCGATFGSSFGDQLRKEGRKEGKEGGRKSYKSQ